MTSDWMTGHNGRVDIDAFVTAHRPVWDRWSTGQAAHVADRRRGRRAGRPLPAWPRTCPSSAPPPPTPMLVGRLSALVARARSAVTGAHTPGLAGVVRFCHRLLPGGRLPGPLVVAGHRRWRSSLVASVVGAWVARNPEVQAAIATPDADHASSSTTTSPTTTPSTRRPPSPARCGPTTPGSRRRSSSTAILLGLPIPCVLWQNAANVGVVRRADGLARQAATSSSA